MTDHPQSLTRKAASCITKAMLSCAMVLSFMLPSLSVCTQAFGDELAISHGTLNISSNSAKNSTISIGVGETATITVSPFQHVQYKGCDKADCPNNCAEQPEDCFTVGKGCICMGPAPALQTATVTATSADESIATTTEAVAVDADLPATDESHVGATQDGTLTITGVAEGTTTVTVSASDLRDWNDAAITYTVNVAPVSIAKTPVMLHQQFETGTAFVNLNNASAAWAAAVTKVTVAPVTDGVVGDAVELSADQYDIDVDNSRIKFNRTSDKPIFTVDEFDKNPVVVKKRFGAVTYPQSKTYEVTIESDGHLTASAQMPFYTGGASTFSIVIDADGNSKTADDRTVAKTWTADQIKSMATFATGSSQCGMTGYRTFAGNGVALTDLLENAGVEVSEQDEFLIDTSDHFGNEFTYEELFGAKRYFTKSIYDDPEVQAQAAASAKLTDEAEIAAASIELRKLLAAKALEDDSTVEPRVNVDYVEINLDASQLADAQMPTAENTTFDELVVKENQFRFMFGLRLVQEEHVAEFDTGAGSKVASQTVKSNLMTSEENTTMKSCYWANSLVVFRGAGKTEQPSTAADKIAKPADPTRAGYSFDGWFTDKACTQAFDFDANSGALDADVTLYAKWTKDSAKPAAGPTKPIAAPAKPLAKGKTFTANKMSFKVNGTKTVTLTACKSTKKSATLKTVKYKGITYKITQVGKKAFKGAKKLATVTLGKHVKKLAAKAFAKSKVKKIVVSSSKLTKKASMKNCLKGSKVKTVKIKAAKAKTKKAFKKYAGKKVSFA